MADIHWEELGLEKDCFRCNGLGRKCLRHDRWTHCNCDKILCERCRGTGKELTSKGHEFLEFLVRHWDTFEEIRKVIKDEEQASDS